MPHQVGLWGIFLIITEGPTYIDQYHPCAGGLECCKKASLGEQPSKQRLSVAYESVSASWFLPEVPALTSLDEGRQAVR